MNINFGGRGIVKIPPFVNPNSANKPTLYGSFEIDKQASVTAGNVTVNTSDPTIYDVFAGFPFMPLPPLPPAPITFQAPTLPVLDFNPILLQPFEVPIDSWGKPTRDPDPPEFELDPKRKIRLED